jgi:uncharacterized LabA/DUF88 family protein
MDEWDLGESRTESRLRGRFEINAALREVYINSVMRRMPDCPAERRADEAWNLCFDESRDWYEQKRRALERKKRFYHGVQSATDFVEIRQEGHWKVDLLQHNVVEKGVDTSLAVDMVALIDTYDVALLISGDADGIPSISHVKNRSKHVGVVEFRRGASVEIASKGTSSRLKLVADFVVQIFESELLRRGLAYPAEPELSGQTGVGSIPRWQDHAS